MNNNALILLWNGNSMPDYLLSKVAEVLTTNGICIPEMLTIKYKDEDGINDALLRDIESKKIRFKNMSKENDIAEAVKQSVIYIGERFKASLTDTNGNLAVFALELSSAVAKANNIVSFDAVGSDLVMHTGLLKAIEILSTTNAIIPHSLARKYHFTQAVVDVIKKIYHNQNVYVSRSI